MLECCCRKLKKSQKYQRTVGYPSTSWASCSVCSKFPPPAFTQTLMNVGSQPREQCSPSTSWFSAGVCFGGKGRLHFIPDTAKVNVKLYVGFTPVSPNPNCYRQNLAPLTALKPNAHCALQLSAANSSQLELSVGLGLSFSLCIQCIGLRRTSLNGVVTRWWNKLDDTLATSTEYRRVTDRQTDMFRPRHRPRPLYA